MSNTGLSVCISEDDSNFERNDTHVLYHKLLQQNGTKLKGNLLLSLAYLGPIPTFIYHIEQP